MKFQVIKTNAGYAVQNTETYTIVGLYNSEYEAVKTCNSLNRIKQ